MLKKAIFVVSIFWASASISAPFLVSAPIQDLVTHCSYTLDSNAKVDFPVDVSQEGNRCKIDLSDVSPGIHIVKLTFVNTNPLWGRSESEETPPFTFTRPSSTLEMNPSGLVITP